LRNAAVNASSPFLSTLLPTSSAPLTLGRCFALTGTCGFFRQRKINALGSLGTVPFDNALTNASDLGSLFERATRVLSTLDTVADAASFEPSFKSKAIRVAGALGSNDAIFDALPLFASLKAAALKAATARPRVLKHAIVRNFFDIVVALTVV